MQWHTQNTRRLHSSSFSIPLEFSVQNTLPTAAWKPKRKKAGNYWTNPIKIMWKCWGKFLALNSHLEIMAGGGVGWGGRIKPASVADKKTRAHETWRQVLLRGRMCSHSELVGWASSLKVRDCTPSHVPRPWFGCPGSSSRFQLLRHSNTIILFTDWSRLTKGNKSDIHSCKSEIWLQ